jgi:hypothetical protein
VRCGIRPLCCSGVLVATNRTLALVTASQMASASVASFFWRLTHAPQQTVLSFDHLVGAQEERLGVFQPIMDIRRWSWRAQNSCRPRRDAFLAPGAVSRQRRGLTSGSRKGLDLRNLDVFAPGLDFLDEQRLQHLRIAGKRVAAQIG